MADALSPIVPYNDGSRVPEDASLDTQDPLANSGSVSSAVPEVDPPASVPILPPVSLGAAPVSAWGQPADDGASAAVPTTGTAWVERPPAAPAAKAPAVEVEKVEELDPWRLWLEGALLVVLAMLDNALSYVTYATVLADQKDLYSVVDAQLLLLEGLDIALLVLAGVGTFCFVVLVVLEECFELELFHVIMNVRLAVSALPCATICAIILYYTESTRWAPFTMLMCTALFVVAWCLHMRLHFARKWNIISNLALDVAWFIAFILAIVILVLYTSDTVRSISKSDEMNCPYSDNVMVPVRVTTLDQWYCAQWDPNQTTPISRTPVNSVATRLLCNTTFVSAFGASLEPHRISCPSNCLGVSEDSDVTGCGIYATDSAVCVAAIHAGVVTDQGGEAVVYGRLGLPLFERCSRFSIVSTERRVVDTTNLTRRLSTPPLVLDTSGLQMPQAFHFNNMDNTREFIWLKRWEQVPPTDPGIVIDRPWTHFKAITSLRVAGVEFEDVQIRLGEYPLQPFPQSNECRVGERGLSCTADSAGFLQVDFCRPALKTCLG